MFFPIPVIDRTMDIPSYGQLLSRVDPDSYSVEELVELLWHARECQQRELRRKGDTWVCIHYDCKEMVHVLNHFMDCQDGKDCTIPFCATSRPILEHWQHCDPEHCDFSRPPKPKQVGEEDVKDWHQFVTEDHRYHLVNLLSLAKYSDILDPKMTSFHLIEDHMFRVADSQTEYYHLLAEEMWQNEGGELVDSDYESDSEDDGRLNLRHHLFLLWHARDCWRREVHRNGDTWECEHYLCREMILVLKHYTFCRSHRECPIPFCIQSRKILLHWEHCRPENCDYCKPPEPAPARALKEAKEWHKSVTDEHRYHLVNLLSLATFSKLIDPYASASHLRRLEQHLFSEANSLTEYYHLLADEIWQEEMMTTEKLRDVDVGLRLGEEEEW